LVRTNQQKRFAAFIFIFVESLEVVAIKGNKMIYVVMGVSGCGKSTVGEMLAKQLNISFYDADDFHSELNKEKMASGIALTDHDRSPWLRLLANHMVDWNASGGAVLACSALKQSYRDILTSSLHSEVQFVYLKGDELTLAQRLSNRSQHFMSSALLQSQLQTLEEPIDAITTSIKNSADAIVATIFKAINV